MLMPCLLLLECRVFCCLHALPAAACRCMTCIHQAPRALAWPMRQAGLCWTSTTRWACKLQGVGESSCAGVGDSMPARCKQQLYHVDDRHECCRGWVKRCMSVCVDTGDACTVQTASVQHSIVHSSRAPAWLSLLLLLLLAARRWCQESSPS
jgi:hypothetical protein